VTKTHTMFVLGTGGHATAVMDVALSAGFEVVGFVDAGHDGEKLGLPVVADVTSTAGSALALGIGSNFLREKVFLETKAALPDAWFPPVVHATASVSPLSKLAEGSVVFAMASVGPQSNLGTGALVNTGASLDHDSQLESFASLAPGVRTGGTVRIGQRAVIGLQAGVLQGVTIGADSVIGAHSFVNDDVDDLSVAWGIPAKVIRKRAHDEPYY
jgi:sugar O-acyltransferase (sialic acid O-acetyltransferase NeuD family)